MTKKHFNAIARAIAERRDYATATMLDALAGDLAHIFTGCNPNFDRERFLRACKGE